MPTVLRARGAVNVVTLILVLGLAAVGYAGWVYIPIWLDSLDMREATAATWNRMAADPDDGRCRAYLIARVNTIGTHWETSGETRVEKRGLGLTEADLVLERDPMEHSGRVQVDYQREVRLWPTDRFQAFDFHAEKAGKFPQ